MAWDFWKSATAEVFWHWSWSKHQRAALLSLLSLAMFGSLYPYVCWSNPPSYFSGSNQVPRSLHEFPWLLLFSPIFANISRFFPTFQWPAFHQQTVSTLSRACWPQARHQRVESVRDWRNRLSDLQHLGPRNRRCISWSNEQSALQRGFGLADVKLKWPQDGSDGVPRIVKLWCWRQLGLLLLNFLWAVPGCVPEKTSGIHREMASKKGHLEDGGVWWRMWRCSWCNKSIQHDLTFASMFCLDTWPLTVVSVADMTTALGAGTLHEWDWMGFVCVVRDYLAADDNISWVLMDSAAVLADTAQLLTNPRWTVNRAEGRSHVTSQMSNNRAMRNSCYTGTGAERLDASKTPVQSAGLQMLGWMRGRHIEQNAFIPSSSIHIESIPFKLHCIYIRQIQHLQICLQPPRGVRFEGFQLGMGHNCADIEKDGYWPLYWKSISWDPKLNPILRNNFQTSRP